MEQIINFRDISDVTKNRKIKSGVLYRSATLDYANDDDMAFLESKNIKTFIDLRTESESKGKEEKYKNVDYIKMPLLTEKLLIAKSPIWLKLAIIVAVFISKYINAAKTIVLYLFVLALNKIGLRGHNDALLEETYPQQQIVKVLKLLTNPETYPVVVFCTQGKDRTGIVIILVLSILNCTEEEIILDYVKSEKALYDNKNSEVFKAAVDGAKQVGITEEFSKSPPEEAMRMLSVIKKLGGVERYLDFIGFGEEDRKKLKKALLS